MNIGIRVGHVASACALLLAAFVAGCGRGAGGAAGAVGDPVTRVLAKSPVIDGHNDLLIHYLRSDGSFAPADTYDIGVRTAGQSDLDRLASGGVGGALFTVAASDPERSLGALRGGTDLVRALAARHAGRLEVAASAREVRAAIARGRMAALMAVEGAGQLGDGPGAVQHAHDLGIRSIGLVWNVTNVYADAATDLARHGGLSERGRALVREANRVGMLVDLSHASDAAARGALEASAAPVILSHSSARALCPAPRNASDEILRLVAANGGIVMVTFAPYFTTAAHWAWFSAGEARWAELQRLHGADTAAARSAIRAWDRDHPEPPVSVADVADHVDHVRAVAGAGHVGLGSDFDGMFSRVPGLDDASTFPTLLRVLAGRGWTEAELAGLTGGNFLRVLERAEAVASSSGRK